MYCYVVKATASNTNFPASNMSTIVKINFELPLNEIVQVFSFVLELKEFH